MFSMKDDRNYCFSGSAIDRMEINGAKLLSSKEGNRVNFYFSGGIFFKTYESDLFSFGDEGQEQRDAAVQKSCPLRFLDLEVDVEGEEYAGNSDNMKFLMKESSVRRNSLGASFPLEVKKLGFYQNSSPEQFGYEGISADGINQKQLDDNWSGLEFDIHLGGMGALAQAVDVKLHFMLAWSEGNTEKSYQGDINVGLPKLYVGVRIGERPGTTAPFPVQGMMSLGVEAVELKKNIVSDEKETRETFYFLLKDFVLKFFGLQFPYGSNRLYVFGNTEENTEGLEDKKKLAFYGAYERK